MKRRNILTKIGASTALVPTTTAVTASNSDAPPIREQLARTVAEARIRHVRRRDAFTQFDPNGIGNPELFYAVANGTYVPVAWVFPIWNGRSAVGHISIGAQTWMPPVIQYGTGLAPQHRLAETKDSETVAGLEYGEKPRFLYGNPMAFGVEAQSAGGLDDTEWKFVDLKRKFPIPRDRISAYGADVRAASRAETEWRRIQVHVERGRTLSYGTSARSTGSISGVPNWSNCGSSWDGCVPIAASMAIGYHEGVPSWNRCDLIHELADNMDTNSDGETWPWNITDGIEEYDSSYDASLTEYGRRSEVMDQIDSGAPCLVCYWGNMDASLASLPRTPTADTVKDQFVGHAETATGYEADDNSWWNPTDPSVYVTTHDTYGGVNELKLSTSSPAYFVTSIEP